MSSVNFIDEFNVFMRYARSNQLTGRERLLWTALFAIANDRAFYNAQTKEYEWPGDFFPIPNSELSLHSTLDKRGIESVRNALKQRGLIDFRPGSRNKKPAEYKINYLSVGVGYKNIPNIDPNNVPKDDPNNVPKDDPNNVPKDDPNSDPIINKYNIPSPSCNFTETDFSSRSSKGGDPGENSGAFDWTKEVETFTDNLFATYCGRKPMKLDYIYAARWLGSLSLDEKNKLTFAFERAFRANKPGQWDYIEGTLTNMKMNELAGREIEE